MLLAVLAGLSSLLCCAGEAQGIAPWVHTWGGIADDTINSVATDASDNLYAVGRTSSFGAGGNDVLLLKYDSVGNLLWSRTWGGGGTDEGRGVEVDNTGAVLVTGVTSSFGAGWSDALLLKFAADGSLLWSRTWGGGSYERADDLVLDASGNIFLASETYSAGTPAVVLKYSSNGDLLETRTWKGSATYDSVYGLDLDSSGNLYAAGIAWYYPADDHTITLFKYDAQGTLLWNKEWSGPRPGKDEPWGSKVIKADQSGNLYLAARTTSFSAGNFDVLILKLDSDGNVLWANTWGGAAFESGFALDFDTGGNVLIVGQTDSYPEGASSAVLLTYTPAGSLVSSRIWRGTGDTGGNSILMDQIGNLFLAGFALNTTGSWQDVIGATASVSGTLTSPPGSTGAPVLTSGAPVGSLGMPTGVSDTGGGGTDAWVMAITPGLLATATPTVTAAPECDGVVVDDLDGTSVGDSHGISYVPAIEGQGARFTRTQESRIQYPFSEGLPKQGTLEWWVKIDSGYQYQNYLLREGLSTALLFTTDIWGGDVTWPGTTDLFVDSGGRVTLLMASEKYQQGPPQLVAQSTPFRFGEWHSIGISVGSQGQHIMVDGQIVASDPDYTQELGSGGTHEAPIDIPTIGESVPGFWNNNQWEGGFEGVVDRFRASAIQRDWCLALAQPGFAATPTPTSVSVTPTPNPVGPVLYVHDSNAKLGTVDVATGRVTVIGTMGALLTDIAFAPNGDLYGVSYATLYRIDPATAALTFVGNLGVDDANALVFAADGALYAAGLDGLLYAVDPITGAALALGSIGFASAGDLAFDATGTLYLSSTDGELIRIDRATAVGSRLGSLGFADVFGLAFGDDGVMYGFAGTQIFSVNLSSGVGTVVSDYGGRGLSVAYGGSFQKEAAPACTPLACSGGQVPYCPGLCPGGCGVECATVTPTATATPENPAPSPLSLTWSQVTSTSCIGPSDAQARPWQDPAFDDSSWIGTTIPDAGSYADRFYRGHFQLAAPVADLSVFFRCDDGCQIYINGNALGSFGNGSCHRLGCVNHPGCGVGYNQCVPPILVPQNLLVAGGNVVAVHVSNGDRIAAQFDATIARANPGTCGNCTLEAGESCDPTVLQGSCSSEVCVVPGLSAACSCPLATLTPPARSMTPTLTPSGAVTATAPPSASSTSTRISASATPTPTAPRPFATATPTRTTTSTRTATPRATRYAAFGDSYSSGEGAPPYEAGTNVDRGNQCHRSTKAYPRELTRLLGLAGIRIEPPNFVACSGAETVNVIAHGVPQYPDQPPQVDQLTDPWDIATITIGGNDVFFASVLKLCAALPLCESAPAFAPADFRPLSAIIDEQIQRLAKRLPATYRDIAATGAPGAALFVLDYPQVFPSILYGCPALGIAYDFTERSFFRDMTRALNAAIASAAAQAGAYYVSVADDFAGHEACSSLSDLPWLNDLRWPATVESFHPNTRGQAEYAAVLRRFISERLDGARSMSDASIWPAANQAPLAPHSARETDESVGPPSLGSLHVVAIPPACEAARSYAPGKELRITGSGFGAAEPVTIRLVASLAQYQAELGLSNANELGALDARVSIPPDAPTSGMGALQALGVREDDGTLLLVELIQLASSTTTDSDGDGIPDVCDTCPGVPDLIESDSDGDGLGDVCDPCPDDPENDLDRDGLCAGSDPCPADAQNDADADGLCTGEDNCPLVANSDQRDADGDGRGDACAGTPCYSVELVAVPPDAGGLSITAPNCRSQQYELGTAVQVSVEPFEGFVFSGWRGDAGGTSVPLTLTVNGNLQIAAAFSVKAPAACSGDCGRDGIVTIDELILGVNIALGARTPTSCAAADADGNGAVTIDELVKAVNHALGGCGE